MNFSIGLTALRANQTAIDTIAQNLANANTEGYHRRAIGLQERSPQRIRGQWIGTGVQVADVTRLRSQILENSITSTVSDLNHIDQRLTIERQIESLLLPGDGSVHDSLGKFFDEISGLAANPGEFIQRSSVVRQGENMADQLQTIHNRFIDMREAVRQQIDLEVETLNREVQSLIELQNQIKVASVQGTPNELYDRRDRLINQIGEKIDVQRFEALQGGFGLSLAGNSISLNDVAVQFEAIRQSDGSIAIQVVGTERTLGEGVGGRLSALTQLHNETLPDYLGKVNQFASALIRNFNQAHATGVGLNGPYSVLKGTRSVDSVDLPLDQANTEFPMESGRLVFSVTDPNGEKRTQSIDIDVTTDSLNDVASKISALSGVQAVINNTTNRIAIVASPGFRFDFTGNIETVPDLAKFTGSATPRLTGTYRGSSNQQLQVSVVGSGTIGLTEGLIAQAVDDTGEVVAEINIGKGYEPGLAVDLIEGVQVSFAYGDVADGDVFITDLIAVPDETGFLSALGINDFFAGSDASDIAVENRMSKDPSNLAAARSGSNGDMYNLLGWVDLRDRAVLGDLNLEGFLGETVTEIGFQLQVSESVKANIQDLQYQYEAERVAVSGVDLNEEMLSLANFQKAYEASIQVVRTAESMMDELYQIVR